MRGRKHTIINNSLPALERELYAFKRRADLVLLALDYKLDQRLSQYWRDFYNDLYVALYPVSHLAFLISDKTFPESHYQAGLPKRIDAKYFERLFKDLVERKGTLCKTAHALDLLARADSTVLLSLRSEVIWQNWLTRLEVIGCHINDTKEIFLSIK